MHGYKQKIHFSTATTSARLTKSPYNYTWLPEAVAHPKYISMLIAFISKLLTYSAEARDIVLSRANSTLHWYLTGYNQSPKHHGPQQAPNNLKLAMLLIRTTDERSQCKMMPSSKRTNRDSLWPYWLVEHLNNTEQKWTIRGKHTSCSRIFTSKHLIQSNTVNCSW